MIADVLLNLLERPQMKQAWGGNSNVLLMAHVDSVRFDPTKVRREGNRIYCGGRADDYAGLAIIETLRQGELSFRWLITDGEESGGWGAQEFITEHEVGEHEWLDDVELCLGLDRRGRGSNMVEYIPQYAGRTMASPAFCTWLEAQGEPLGLAIVKGHGTWCDMEIISRSIPDAVNLSVGYYEPHSVKDYIELDQLTDTLRLVQYILQKI